MVCFGVGFAKIPAMNAFIAEVFLPNELARVDALSSLASTISLSAALPAFAFAFDAHARGVRAAAPFAAGAVCAITGIAILLVAICPDGKVRRFALQAIRSGKPLEESQRCFIAESARNNHASAGGCSPPTANPAPPRLSVWIAGIAEQARSLVMGWRRRHEGAQALI